MFYEEIKNKTRPVLHFILSIKDSLQQQIHFSGNIFGNKCCRCNEGLLYNTCDRLAKLVEYPANVRQVAVSSLAVARLFSHLGGTVNLYDI